MIDITNLQDVLVKHKNSNKPIVFCSSGGLDEALSYKDVYWNALRLLAYLQMNGIKKGDHLLFQISDSKKFVVTFWACILGGIIPAPLSVAEKSQGIKKIFLVWDCLNKPFLCIERQEMLEKLKFYASNKDFKQFHDNINFCNVNLESFKIEKNISSFNLSLENKIIKVKSDDTAFVQFSSGSTGSPKGIVLTHSNLISNIKGITKSAKMTKDDCHLSWLPLTHDMGLIGAHLTSSLLGTKQVLINTDVFARNPKIWMEKTDQYRASVLYTPNYGLKVLMYSIERKIFNWDLTCIRLILTAAEPISLKLCDSFIDSLSPYKLDKNAICPAYGLAEASVAVSISSPGVPIKGYHLDRNNINLGKAITEISPYAKDAMTVVDVGRVVKDCNICIKDKNGQNLPDKVVGLIHIKGHNVTRGYINNIHETRKVLDKSGWLNTGDLGFIKNGNLVITGREKDIIFANGINIYPHDIESLCSDIEFKGFKSRNLVVSSVYNSYDEEEQLILFVRYKSDMEDFVSLVDKLRRHINSTVGIKVLAVIPIDNIPKTTSGKICRYQLKEDFSNGIYTDILEKIKSLSVTRNRKITQLLENPPTEKIEQILIERIEKVIHDLMGCKISSREDNLIDMGIDSLKAIRLKNSLQVALNIDVPASVVFDYPTVNKLINFLVTQYMCSSNDAYNELERIAS